MSDWKPEAEPPSNGQDPYDSRREGGAEHLRTAADLAKGFAATAAERDAEGGTAKRERDALRASGLLRLVVPAEFGGLGRSWTEALQVVRIIAEADGSLAHLLGYHYLVLSAPRLIGSARQSERFYRLTGEGNLFWGNAFNPPRMDPLDPGRIAAARVHATPDGDGWRINGRNQYSSGATDSDLLVLSAVKAGGDRLAESFLVAVVPTDRRGISVNGDWNSFGQRQTDSGSVDFHDVRVEKFEVLDSPGPFALPFGTLRTCLAQTTLTHIYLGIARGALAAAIAFLRTEAKPYFLSGVGRADEDPFVQEKLGGLWADLEAASLFADKAAGEFQAAWDKGEALTAQDRGRLAVTIAGAKVSASRTGLRAAGDIFELMGAASTRGDRGLDRFWRNLRTHTLHDPVSYKLRDLGAWLLQDRHPKPSFYS